MPEIVNAFLLGYITEWIYFLEDQFPHPSSDWSPKNHSIVKMDESRQLTEFELTYFIASVMLSSTNQRVKHLRISTLEPWSLLHALFETLHGQKPLTAGATFQVCGFRFASGVRLPKHLTALLSTENAICPAPHLAIIYSPTAFRTVNFLLEYILFNWSLHDYKLKIIRVP